MTTAVGALAPLLVRHLASYLELGAAAAAEYRGSCARRVLLLVAGMVAAIAGLIALWATGLVVVWNTQWRVMYAAGTGVLLLLIALLALRGAISSRTPGPSVGALKGEFQKDLELFQQWKSTL